jgi:hypothetical protein
LRTIWTLELEVGGPAKVLLGEAKPQVEPGGFEAGLRRLVDVMRRQEAGVRLLSIDIPPVKIIK